MQPPNRTILARHIPMRPAIAAGAVPRSLASPNCRLLTIAEVCAMVGVSRAMIYKSMRRGSAPFPKPIKIGAVSRWLVEDVETWVNELRRIRGQCRGAGSAS